LLHSIIRKSFLYPFAQTSTISVRNENFTMAIKARSTIAMADSKFLNDWCPFDITWYNMNRSPIDHIIQHEILVKITRWSLQNKISSDWSGRWRVSNGGWQFDRYPVTSKYFTNNHIQQKTTEYLMSQLLVCGSCSLIVGPRPKFQSPR
jgi:hypothetical protein